MDFKKLNAKAFGISLKCGQHIFVLLGLLTDGPAVVNINLFVRSITTISDIKMVSMVWSEEYTPGCCLS